MTQADAIVIRAQLPCTPSEIAAILQAPLPSVRAQLYQLRKQGRVFRTDRCVKNQPWAGRKEYFWIAA